LTVDGYVNVNQESTIAAVLKQFSRQIRHGSSSSG
jgi:hypothetical protein